MYCEGEWKQKLNGVQIGIEKFIKKYLEMTNKYVMEGLVLFNECLNKDLKSFDRNAVTITAKNVYIRISELKKWIDKKQLI